MDIPLAKADIEGTPARPDGMALVIIALHASALVLFFFNPLYAAVALGLGVTLAVGIARPLPVLLFSVAFIWVNEPLSDLYPSSQFTAWKDVLLFIVALGWLTRTALLRRPMLVKSPISIPLGLVIVLYLIGVVVNPSFRQGILGIKNTIFYMSWYFVLPDIIHTKQDARRLVMAVIFGGICLSIYSIWCFQQPYGYFPPNKEGQLLPGALVLHFSVSPFLLPLGVFLGVALLPSLPPLQKVFALVGAVLAITAVIIALTRGQSFAMLALLMFMGVLSRRKVPFVMLLAAVVAGGIVQVAFKANVSARAQSVLNSMDTSRVEREQEFTTVTLPWVLSHPWGSGTGAMSAKGSIANWGGGESTTDLLLQQGYIHNGFLLVAIEIGWTGLAIYLWLLWASVSCAYKAFRTANDPFVRDLALGLLAIALFYAGMHWLGAMISTALISFDIWIMFGLIALLPRLDQEQAGAPA